MCERNNGMHERIRHPQGDFIARCDLDSDMSGRVTVGIDGADTARDVRTRCDQLKPASNTSKDASCSRGKVARNHRANPRGGQGARVLERPW